MHRVNKIINQLAISNPCTCTCQTTNAKQSDDEKYQHQPIDSTVHSQIIEYIIASGHSPSISKLLQLCNVVDADSQSSKYTKQDVLDSITRLEHNHGVVLHPDSNPANDPKVWIIHPFSMTPQLFWVESTIANMSPNDDDNYNEMNNGWFAPCIWCACGIANLIGGNAKICTNLEGKTGIGNTIEIMVKNDEIIGYYNYNYKKKENGGGKDRLEFESQSQKEELLLDADNLFGHFGIPVLKAWDNVHHFCGTALVFEKPNNGSVERVIKKWCDRRGYEKIGHVTSVKSIYKLGKLWYGNHRNPKWIKWTMKEATDIINEQVGFKHDIWKLTSDENETF